MSRIYYSLLFLSVGLLSCNEKDEVAEDYKHFMDDLAIAVEVFYRENNKIPVNIAELRMSSEVEINYDKFVVFFKSGLYPLPNKTEHYLVAMTNFVDLLDCYCVIEFNPESRQFYSMFYNKGAVRDCFHGVDNYTLKPIEVKE